jgi:beta-lactamase superfamily II metal-dependent hydrolase
MEFVIDFLYVGDGDAIIIWARQTEQSDFVFFVDGGNSGNGKKVVDHYNQWIKPHLYQKRAIGFINTHPHEDHIDGLLEILNLLQGEISFGIYNDPVECIEAEHRDRIHRAYMNGEDPDITHLYETFEQIEKLNNFCQKNSVKRFNAYADNNSFLNGALRILSPYKDFYVNLVQYFTDVDFLKTTDLAKTFSDEDATERDDLEPCNIVDESNDTSPENLTSVVLQLTDSQNKKYILTGDAGTDAFDYMESEGFDASNIHLVQLPHHGSRRNISAAWIKKFNAPSYVVSAEGNKQHPRRAVVNCVKRNTGGKVYSTHTLKGVISYTTNKGVFPPRNWGPATPL